MQPVSVSFAKEVGKIRENELYHLRKLSLIHNFNAILSFAIPVVVSLLTFAIYSRDNKLTPAKTFVTMALFNLCRYAWRAGQDSGKVMDV